MRWVGTLRTNARTPFLQVVKTSVAVVVAWIACDLLFQQPPIFAAIAALLVVQPSVNQTLAKGIERSVGVILGVVLAFGIGYVFGSASWVVLSAVVVALVASWALKLGPGSANQIPISAMLVLSIGSLTPDYAVERIVETVIGAVVGLVVNLAIVPPVLLAPAHTAVVDLARAIAARLETLSVVLTTAQSPAQLHDMLAAARELRSMQTTAVAAIAQARESLTLNPRGGRVKRDLDADDALFVRLTALVTRVVGMTRTVHDRWHPGLAADPVIEAIAEDLRRAAHDLRLLVRADDDAEPITSELPALTAPLTIGAPERGDWVLIGSLLEDLRRVRDEIIDSDDG